MFAMLGCYVLYTVLHTSFANDATSSLLMLLLSIPLLLTLVLRTILYISICASIYYLSICYLSTSLLPIYYYRLSCCEAQDYTLFYYTGSSAFRILSYPILSIHAFSSIVAVPPAIKSVHFCTILSALHHYILDQRYFVTLVNYKYYNTGP